MRNSKSLKGKNKLEMNKLGEGLIFIISQPRAGSTLLQRILSGHPEIHSTAEPWLMLHPIYALKRNGIATEYESSLARQGLDDFLMQVPEGEELYIKALREMASVLYNRALGLSVKRFFLDKTPRYYFIIPELYRVFPEAKFIFLLRNPMAVLSSVLSTWFGNQIQALVKSPSHYIDLTKGPHYLVEGIKKLKENAIVVHYEALVRKPKGVIQHVCNRIGIPFYENMLKYGQHPAPKGRFGDSVGVYKHNRPVSDYIDKWVKNLAAPNLIEFTSQYLSSLGSDVFSNMGYSYQEIKDKLGAQGSLNDQEVSQKKIKESTVLNQQGEDLFTKGDTEGALNALRKAIEIAPNFATAHNNLGVLYWQAGEIQKAVEHFAKALEIDPNDRDTILNCGELFKSLEKIEDAKNIYSSYLQKNPEDEEIAHAFMEADFQALDCKSNNRIGITNFSLFTYSKNSHFSYFKNNELALYKKKINKDDCDLKVYQDLLIYTFILENIPKGSKILEIGGGNSRVLNSIRNDYECWNIDKLEGLGNGPTTVDLSGCRLIKAYMGEFSKEVPDNYFDFVFSISALEHVDDNEETFHNVCLDIDRVLKSGGLSLHALDVVIKKTDVWNNKLLPYMFNTFDTINTFIPLRNMVLDSDLYYMSKRAYSRCWEPITKTPYEEFGKPVSYNILWKKPLKAHDGKRASGRPNAKGRSIVENRQNIIKILKQNNELKNKPPKISIVTPSYNQGKFLEECIDSILSQNYPNLEYIIMDGGSTDNSLDIIKKYERYLTYWQSKPDGGQYAAINEGFKKSTGEIMCWLNSDDKFHSDSLFFVAYIFKHFMKVQWIMGRPSVWDKNGALNYILDPLPQWSRSDYLSRHYGPPHIQQESTFWRRSLWGEAGSCLDTDLNYAGDLELWSRFFRFAELYTVDFLLGGFRSHSDQKTATMMKEYDREANQVIDREIELFAKSNEPLSPSSNPIRLADLCLVEGQKAINHFVKALEIDPNDRDTVLNCGDLLKRLGKVKDARIVYLSYLRKNPDDEEVSSAWADLQDTDEDKELVEIIKSDDREYLVTAIVSTYNSEEFIRECLENLEAQTISDKLEIVVVDAASPQNEGEIVKEFQKLYSNITYIRTKGRIGVYAAWNIAIKASSGRYCISVSTNDYLRKDACEILARALDENLDCMLVYGDTYLTRNPHETFVKNTHYGAYQWPDYRFEDLLRNCMVGPHPIWRKSVHEKIGYFDERYIADGDQEFWLRIGERYNLIHISEFTGLQWITPYSLSGEGSIPLLEVAHIHTRYQKRYAQRLKKGKLRCSIIIPLFNQVEYTKQCLEALIQNTPDELYEVIIVDNASTDGTKEFLKSLEGDVKIITNKENLGFAKACNQGAKTAQGGYLVFLNNDTKVLPGWLDELVKCAREDKKRAVVGAKLLYPDDTIQHAGVAITDSPHPIFPYHIHHKKPSNAPEVNVMREYQAVTGACMLVRKDLFEKMGGFDEDFLNGYEDVDLCFRIRENGYKIIYCPESIVYHYESVSDGRFSAVEHNVKRLHQKWLGKIHADQDSANLKQVNSVVSIIILTHNQLEYTKKCINSIFKHTKEPFELIVVDNGSTDGTVEYLESEARGQRSEVGGRRSEGRRQKAKSRGQRAELRRQKSEVRIKIIKNSENLGFAVGNNQGMAEAKGDYVLLMNNDLVVTPGWLTRMIACAERNPRIGIVGPVSNYVSGPQLIKEVSYDTTSLARLNKFSNAFSKKHAGQAKPFWRVVGFCMLIKRAVIDKIGGLDGRFGLGNFEDDDFSLRAALAGFESWIAQDCFVHHFGSRTFVGAKIDYRESLHKNWEIFKQKWGIPADVAYGAPYDMALVVKDGFIPAKHYCPLMPEEYSVADGEKLFGMDDIEGAKRIFEQILSADPNSIEALNNLGVIAFQQGGIDQAISYFTSVLETDESYFEAIENLGKCGEAQKEYLKAAEWFERALKLKPDDISLLNAMGNCFIQLEDSASAREIYEKSLGLDSSQESIEVILRELGGLEEAKNKA